MNRRKYEMVAIWNKSNFLIEVVFLVFFSSLYWLNMWMIHYIDSYKFLTQYLVKKSKSKSPRNRVMMIVQSMNVLTTFPYILSPYLTPNPFLTTWITHSGQVSTLKSFAFSFLDKGKYKLLILTWISLVDKENFQFFLSTKIWFLTENQK